MIPRLMIGVLWVTLAVMIPDCQILAQNHELVIHNGRVMDPQSGLDAIRDVAIDKGVISAMSEVRLMGRETIDAAGLVVAPGFIDLHQHAWDDESIHAGP